MNKKSKYLNIKLPKIFIIKSLIETHTYIVIKKKYILNKITIIHN